MPGRKTNEERAAILREKIEKKEAEIEVMKEQMQRLLHPVTMKTVMAKAKESGLSPMEIAEKLGLPQITYAADIHKDGSTVTVKRMLEDGYMTIKTQTPCLLTCIKELNDPRYMSIGGIYATYSKPLETFDYDKLKDHKLIDATTIGLKGSPTNIFKSFTPPQKGVGVMLEGNGKETCEKLAGILAAKHII